MMGSLNRPVPRGAGVGDSNPPVEPEAGYISSFSKTQTSWNAAISSPSSTFILFAACVFYALVLSISAASTKVVDEWGHALRLKVITSTIPLHHYSADLGRNLLPHIDAPWLPDTLIISLLFIAALAFIWPNPLNRHHVGDRRKRLALLLAAHASILIMRTSTTVVTVHPVSSPFCTSVVASQLQNHHSAPPASSAHSNPPNVMVREEEVGFILNTGCYDMMFSGHVSFSVLMALFSLQAPNLPMALKLLSLFFTLCSFIGNVAVGDHYSSDVLVGSYISFLVFMVFRKPLLKTYIHHHHHHHHEVDAKSSTPTPPASLSSGGRDW